MDLARTKNIYCIGRNYRLHAQELGNKTPSSPMHFLKSPASLRGAKPINGPFADEAFHFEAEIVLIVGAKKKLGSHVLVHESLSGFGLGLDLTRRAVQKKLKEEGLPWAAAKNFKGSAVVLGFCPFSQCKDPGSIDFEFCLNGVCKQRGLSTNMLFSFEIILNYLLQYVDLEENDLIYTGTPEGVGAIRYGDEFRLSSHCLGLDEEGVL